jgi:hypothetical protein
MGRRKLPTAQAMIRVANTFKKGMAKLLWNLASMQEELATEAATIIVEIGFPAVPTLALQVQASEARYERLRIIDLVSQMGDQAMRYFLMETQSLLEPDRERDIVVRNALQRLYQRVEASRGDSESNAAIAEYRRSSVTSILSRIVEDVNSQSIGRNARQGNPRTSSLPLTAACPSSSN